MSRLCGIFGRPYVDLSTLIDTSGFDAIDEEIVCALPRLETSYTGGSLKWMGVTAPWVNEDPYVDYMRVISEMSREEVVKFVSYGVAPDGFDPARAHEYQFGDETDHPLSREQMLYLKFRYGVYFPWKVCYHLLENDRWEDKHSGEGKELAASARELLPKTVAFIESLPFEEIGRIVLFGIEANDHAPAHRDSEPGKALSIAQSISFAPHQGPRKKRFYVCDPKGGNKTVIDAPIYWFNDADYHGVEADPFFRYSIRVDGVFDPAFVDEIRATG
jgi:Rieske 2Fe-2S family protein